MSARRQLVELGDPISILLRQIENADWVEPVTAARALIRLRPEEQVTIGGLLQRIGARDKRTDITRLGVLLAARGARRISAELFPNL